MKKKLMIAIAIAVLLVFSAVTAQDASAQAKTKPAKEKKVKAPKGKTADSGAAAEPYEVDLSKLPLVKNAKPFTNIYDNLIIVFPDFDVDLTKYSRVTIRAKCFNEKGEELTPADTQAMVTLFSDPSKDIFSDSSPNLILKELNLGGYSGQVAKDKGSRIRLSANPGGILLQNSAREIKFIELTEVTFHNR